MSAALTVPDHHHVVTILAQHTSRLGKVKVHVVHVAGHTPPAPLLDLLEVEQIRNRTGQRCLHHRTLGAYPRALFTVEGRPVWDTKARAQPEVLEHEVVHVVDRVQVGRAGYHYVDRGIVKVHVPGIATGEDLHLGASVPPSMEFRDPL